ncbi:MAG: galactosyltransferase-related protein, partial [Verrucomicrobia bacterium]|nr:galactosyltransferase-related protein [Verrucomicrobiota bacterium]
IVGWGHEDDDFIKRMELSGTKIGHNSRGAFSIHQYHPRERLDNPLKTGRSIRINLRMLNSDHTIIRNPAGWGNLEMEHIS